MPNVVATPVPSSPTPLRKTPTLKVLAAVWAWRWYGLLAATAIIAAVYFGLPMLLGPVVVADPVLRADFVQTIVASGHVEAPFRVNIGSTVVGTVVDVPVIEGQAVKAGDTLVRLDDVEARAAVQQTTAAVAEAAAHVRQLHELILPSAEASLVQAKATLLASQQARDRAATLSRDGYGTKVTLEDATRALDVAAGQLRAAELQVATNRPAGSDFVMAQSQLEQASANLRAAQSRLAHTIILAPRDGILIFRDVERGNIVQPTSVLMKLSPALRTELVVQIDEKNLGQLALGQRARASADAFATQSFAAEVNYINPAVDLQRASVEVKLQVAEPPDYLRQDMTVSVDIETSRHARALIVASTVVHDASGKPYVLEAVDGRAVRRSVKLGLVGGGKTEILDGVTEGALLLPAAATVVEGGRVRARVAAPMP